MSADFMSAGIHASQHELIASNSILLQGTRSGKGLLEPMQKGFEMASRFGDVRADVCPS